MNVLVGLLATCLAVAWITSLSGCGHSVAAALRPTGHADSRVGPGVVPAKVLVEPRASIRQLIRAIDHSQTQVFVEDYILTDRRVERALQRAAAQGVAVFVILEPHPIGMGAQPEHMANLLLAAGVHVRWGPPEFALTHAKFMVLDDRVAVVSTANMSRSAFQRNRDVLVFDRTMQDVHALSNLFRRDWNQQPAVLDDANLLVSPYTSRRKVQRFIRMAHRSIDIYGEELTDVTLADCLASSARRGVRIRIILPGQPGALAAGRLRRAGVHAHTLSTPYIHAKVLVVDGREAFIGSENMSSQSLDRNREVGIFVRGPAIRDLETVFDQDWARSSS